MSPQTIFGIILTMETTAEALADVLHRIVGARSRGAEIGVRNLLLLQQVIERAIREERRGRRRRRARNIIAGRVLSSDQGDEENAGEMFVEADHAGGGQTAVPVIEPTVSGSIGLPVGGEWPNMDDRLLEHINAGVRVTVQEVDPNEGEDVQQITVNMSETNDGIPSRLMEIGTISDSEDMVGLIRFYALPEDWNDDVAVSNNIPISLEADTALNTEEMLDLPRLGQHSERLSDTSRGLSLRTDDGGITSARVWSRVWDEPSGSDRSQEIPTALQGGDSLRQSHRSPSLSSGGATAGSTLPGEVKTSQVKDEERYSFSQSRRQELNGEMSADISRYSRERERTFEGEYGYCRYTPVNTPERMPRHWPSRLLSISTMALLSSLVDDSYLESSINTSPRTSNPPSQ